MAEEEKNNAEEPEITANAVNLADLVGDDEPIEDELEEEELEEEEVEEEEPEPEKGSLDDLMGDIFAEEAEENDHLKAFGDLEHLTMVEVASEVEAVLEELRIRQGSDE